MKKFGFALLGCLLLVASIAEAARTIRIVSRKEGIQLTNPSTVSVNYDVTCYKADGSVTSASAGQTLSPNASVNHGTGKTLSDFTPLSNACTSNGPTSFGLTGGMSAVGCNTSNTYADAALACSDGLEVCNYVPHNYINCGAVSTSMYWVRPPVTGTVTFSNSACSWANTTFDSTTDGLVMGEYCSSVGNSYCSINGGSNYSSYCGAQPKTATIGTLCCPKTASSYCKVTINTADANAFLASPHFKGGAPF